MQTIYLDISNKGVIPTVYAKQGDVGRKFEVVLTDSGLPYIPPSGAVFSVWYSGESGEGNYTDIGEKTAFSLSGNKVTVEMISQMLSNPGRGVLCIILNSHDEKQISSWNIDYVCESVPGADSEEAKKYYTAFSKAVENLPYPDDSLSVAGKAADAAETGKQLKSKAPMDYAKKVGNPYNLMDNSDFRNPVNQRGSDYATGKLSYPIDRWQYSYDGDTVRGGAGYDSTNKYLYLVNDSSNAGNTMIYHKITKEKLKTGKYTIAVRQDGTNLSIFILAYINGGALKSSTLTPNADGISLMAFEITEVQTDLTIYIYAAPNQTLTFSWAALYEGEYTAETLPEYQPKGYGVELVECQRYYREFTWLGGGNNFAPIRVMLPLPIPMRIANPTVTYKKTGGNGVVSISMNGNDAVDITVSEDYATLRIYISADL